MNLSSISTIKDPFNVDCMTSFRISCYKWSGRWAYRGYVEFQNGNTKGEQEFEEKDMKTLMVKMEAFMEELNGLH